MCCGLLQCCELAEKLAEDMEGEGLRGKTLTLKLKPPNFEVSALLSDRNWYARTPYQIRGLFRQWASTVLQCCYPSCFQDLHAKASSTPA